MHEIDRLTVERYGTPSLSLMEAAARAVARTALHCLAGDVSGKAVLILCGPGNNGGDGAATARALSLMGAHVHVVLFAHVAETNGDGRTNFEILRGLTTDTARYLETADFDFDLSVHKHSPGTISFTECDSEASWVRISRTQLEPPPDLIIDALFGTGLRRPLEGLHRTVVEHLLRLRETARQGNSSGRIVSVDIPSGLNSDLAEPIGAAVSADMTVTFTAPKPANILPPASNYNGELLIADIGSPVELIKSVDSQLFLLDESDARNWLVRTRYTPDSFKNTHGHALVIAGSRGFAGAAALCGAAALRSGAGLVTIATPVSAQPAVAAQAMPEIMTAALAETDRGGTSDEAIDYALRLASKANVVAIGPGLSSEDERTRAFVRSFIERRSFPVVVDADGLNALAPWPLGMRGSDAHPLVLTPHQGEMLRLMGASEKTALADRVVATRNFATTHSVILVLKGTRALIAAPDGRVFVNPTGNAGLGTAGTGDTLTGIIAGFIAQASGLAINGKPVSLIDTVIAALYIGGLAGDLAAKQFGMRFMVASDVREHLSVAIRSLDPEGELPQGHARHLSSQ